jgi:hypothetical protein
MIRRQRANGTWARSYILSFCGELFLYFFVSFFALFAPSRLNFYFRKSTA